MFDYYTPVTVSLWALFYLYGLIAFYIILFYLHYVQF